MDAFLATYLTFGCSTMFFDNWSADFDIIANLPLEVAVIILRKLDGKSLLSAAQVCSRWLQIIKFDRVLRNTVRVELAKQRQEKLKRHMALSDHANARVHLAAFYPDAKKPRRTFEKSIKKVEKPNKKRSWASTSNSTTSNLKRMR